MVSGGGAFGRFLGYEGGALMSGISALIKETPQSSLTPSAKWEHSKKMAAYEPESRFSPDTKSADAFVLDF